MMRVLVLLCSVAGEVHGRMQLPPVGPPGYRSCLEIECCMHGAAAAAPFKF